ncbi:MAG: NAD-dependent malic enzyme, mitochondrial [Bathelium mastoideum]|nr:MAG: NAD-dependent malic enzyme, mitochondrial [Bathelium mastoideum]
MTSMKEQNEVLYYALIQKHLKEVFPVIYTPTEGEAIADFSRLFRRPTGCFLNIFDQDRIEEDLGRWGNPEDIDLIVVSDGEQILGIGDQGVGGILISVAKLVIYTSCAGIHPARTLPVVLDCGTDNQKFLDDELYLGLRRPRVRGERYDSFVDKFVHAALKRFPKAYLHFEDFGLDNARRILDKYTPKIACFNDDVQGTGCVTLAAVLAALHVTKTKMADLRVVMFGAGSAGTGIADQIRDAIAVESGKSAEEASKQIFCVDKPGLLLKSKSHLLTPAQIPYAFDDAAWSGEGPPPSDLLSVIRDVHPHVLIGTSTQPKAFTESIVREMAAHVDRPIIFPLSNPTRLHEADPQDLATWTDGRALVATGSPFSPVTHNGITKEIAECNNSVAFPGIGLGAILARPRRLPPSLLVAATRALAAQAPVLKDENKGLLPDVVDVREISVGIAKTVIRKAVEEGLAQADGIPDEEGELEEWIREQMWDARYRPLRLVEREQASRHARGEAGAGTVDVRA